ncbi:NAD(P)H-dependent oxidoreductase [Cronobacter turicensis]|uniref:NAD(P)H-dependent oxidoreductase n=1 Tax=Cronobacter turicensis TaxID=413502 RepID=UPI0013759B2D|nr:NAD(P)H-dependent oxidoreductase [Cronobacter turicensis]EKM0377469.1 NAD(P)H-dependent oxidoreductase [Cronobacter turicensis]MDK1185611.1 NAD(P)H-dependent oxidoreductase [Cronobacter turicensis]MDK1205655.1 NAD(P)H-dependent oxidoreductase [Cronobacter turicensis]MDK1213826.1 NAD(P)H-dependent oxidoreductase [Cronobacter turicensis]MDK1218552.1 NAD(P)H-dependent oxidoreductase [Cronobacter turicensis]
MHALIVVSHPLASSLTHRVAHALAEGITSTHSENSADIADLTREGFNPVFNESDYAAFMKTAPLPPDVAREQARIDNADALVLVFPVYWWSMPGLLKGWIDRVFANGWAYEESPEGKVVKKLGHLPVHLVSIGGADRKTYDKHGYHQAWDAQIVHGIFDYCGAPVVTNETLFLPDLSTPDVALEQARALGERIFIAPV